MGRIRKDALDLEFLPETKRFKIKGPKKVAYFSTYFDKEHKEVYYPDNSSQRYLVSTELNEPINCLEGFNPRNDEFLRPIGWSNFMRWISDNYEIIRGLVFKNNSNEEIDFICSNNELKRIMLSLYNQRGWLIHAFKVRREIFLCLSIEEKTSLETESVSQHVPEKANTFRYARFNVIRKITKRVKERELNSNSETNVFSTVSFLKIGQHRILHTGFTEFVMSKDDVNKPIDQANFAALKLMHGLYDPLNGGFNISLYQSLYWWTSAFVSGVETLVCGDLYKNFTVSQLEIIPVKLTLNKKISYEQKKCLITLHKILDFIKSEVKESNKVYDFHLDKKTKEVTVSLSEKSMKDFVTPWY